MTSADGCSREDAAEPARAAPETERPRATAEAGDAPEQPGPIAGFQAISGAGLLKLARGQEHGAIVNLWASWCGSCKQELPMLKQVSEAFGGHGLPLVPVAADAPQALPKARALLTQAGLTGTAYYLSDRMSSFRRAVDPRWQGAVPATFLIDRDGKVRYFWNGPVLADEIRDVVQGFLAGEPIDGMTDFTTSQ